MHAFVWILLALWAPPVIFTVLVDLKLVGEPRFRLSVVARSGPAAQHHAARPDGGGAADDAVAPRPRVAAVVRIAWRLVDARRVDDSGRLRLIGASDLVSRETLVTLAALAVASYVVFEVRGRFTRAGALTPRPTTDQPPAALRPDTM